MEKICVHLEQELPRAQKTELGAKQQFDLHDSEEMTQLISNYLIRIIKIHKNLSYNRFTCLFTLHTTFLKRLQILLNKVAPEQRDRVQSMVEKILSPEIALYCFVIPKAQSARGIWVFADSV